MLYYQVNENADQRRPCRAKPENFLIKNELITAAEWRKNFPGVAPERYAKPVEISRKKTFWFFGARFADEINATA